MPFIIAPRQANQTRGARFGRSASGRAGRVRPGTLHGRAAPGRGDGVPAPHWFGSRTTDKASRRPSPTGRQRHHPLSTTNPDTTCQTSEARLIRVRDEVLIPPRRAAQSRTNSTTSRDATLVLRSIGNLSAQLALGLPNLGVDDYTWQPTAEHPHQLRHNGRAGRLAAASGIHRSSFCVDPPSMRRHRSPTDTAT